MRLDLTADELVVDPGVLRPVGHPYSDAPPGSVQVLCYSYEELFAEKLRALGERTRARDLYDVVHLHRNSAYTPGPRRVLERRCPGRRGTLVETR